jgi:hypothetical protein
MHLVAGETRAGQQVSQCGLRIFLIAGRRERERLRTVAQNLQQARRRRQVAEPLTRRDNGLPDLLIQAADPCLQRDVQLAVPGVGPVRRRGDVQSASGVALSLICTRTAIPAS